MKAGVSSQKYKKQKKVKANEELILDGPDSK
jgi:hypothetical protein